jgi:hypothetical protein
VKTKGEEGKGRPLPPRYVTVRYRGVLYLLDLIMCRRALVTRQVDGELDSMESLANAVSISRSTGSRFFSGRPTSLAVTLKILAALHLKFADVAKPVDGDDADGAAGAGAVLRPVPRRPDPDIGKSRQAS